jgi:ankyrin repeat protein
MITKKVSLAILLIIFSLSSLDCKKKGDLGVNGKPSYKNIFEAIIFGDSNDVNKFLNVVEIDTKDHLTGLTPLHFAASYGKLDIATLLIEKGANVNAKNKIGGTPLCSSAMGKGDFLKVANLLIEKGADVNVRTNDGSSILHFAVLNGQPKMIELLLAKGADPKIKNNNGRTPIELVEILNRTKFRKGSPMYERKDGFEECLKILREFQNK